MLDLGLGVLMDVDEHATFATADGVAVGTVDYMSPEQACGRDVDGRSDLFSLGCSLYHLITGRQAFPGDTPIERLGRRINNKHVPITDLRPDLPSSLVNVLDKLLANKPHDRYQTAAEAAEAAQRPDPAEEAPRAAPQGRARAGRRAEAGRAAPPPVIVKVQPEYPGWFRPLASLAEQKPTSALMAMIGGLGAAMAVGFALGWILKG